MNNDRKSKNNILSFHQPAEFFVKKAEKQIDAGNFLEALHLYRRVLGMDPGNTDYLLSIAQIYSEMGLYAESNDVLHKIIRNGSAPTECLFALGCNYIGLKKYEFAEDAFEQYLEVDPDGEYVEDIDEIFDYYEDDDDDESMLHDVGRTMLAEDAYKGKQHLDNGEYSLAIRHLSRVVSKDASMVSAANNLALSHFFGGDKKRAVEISQRVIAAHPANLHACCNLAMFHSELGAKEEALHYLKMLESHKDIEPHDMHKVALTYCELGLHSKAYLWFSRLAALSPYDIRILHFHGLCAFNCGKFAESQSVFNRILKIDPANSLAAYYRQKAQDAKKSGTKETLEYVYQVQFSEIKRRICYLNDCMKQKHGSLSDLWRGSGEFRSVIRWGLRHGDEYIKKIVLEIMSTFADAEVENEYRDYLLKSAEPDNIKNDVFLYLKRMGAAEPYIAFIKGGIAEVRVGSVSEDLSRLPRPYAAALASFLHHAYNRLAEHEITSGIEMLAAVSAADASGGAWVRSARAFAAALEYHVRVSSAASGETSKKELVREYRTTMTAFSRYLQKISETSVQEV